MLKGFLSIDIFRLFELFLNPYNSFFYYYMSKSNHNFSYSQILNELNIYLLRTYILYAAIFFIRGNVILKMIFRIFFFSPSFYKEGVSVSKKAHYKIKVRLDKESGRKYFSLIDGFYRVKTAVLGKSFSHWRP